MTSDDERIVSVSFDKTVRVWDEDSHELLHIFTGHNRPIQCVAVPPTGEYAVTGARDATVRLWNMMTADGSHITLAGHSAGVSRAFTSEDGRRIISVSWNGEVFMWDARTHEYLRQVIKESSHELEREKILDLIGEEHSKDDNGFVIPFQNHTIMYGKGRDAKVVSALESEIRAWELSPDRSMICAGLQSGQVALLVVELQNLMLLVID